MNTDRRKITDLMDRLERVKIARAMIPSPDDLSLSLWELGAELAALDEEGLSVEAADLGISRDDVLEMARTYAR